MPQITVYVSDELFERMAAAKGQLPGPSAIFTEALKQRLEEIESAQKQTGDDDDMAAAVARLKREKQMGIRSAIDAGISAGEEFATQEAPYELLAQLEEVRGECPLPGHHVMADLLGAFDMGGMIPDLLRENEIVGDAAASAFWDGFLRGALAVWKKVERRI